LISILPVITNGKHDSLPKPLALGKMSLTMRLLLSSKLASHFVNVKSDFNIQSVAILTLWKNHRGSFGWWIHRKPDISAYAIQAFLLPGEDCDKIKVFVLSDHNKPKILSAPGMVAFLFFLSNSPTQSPSNFGPLRRKTKRYFFVWQSAGDIPNEKNYLPADLCSFDVAAGLFQQQKKTIDSPNHA